LSNELPGTLIERTFRERIILVGVAFPGRTDADVDQELNELAQLVDSAGADEVGRVVQRRDAPDPATFVGRGKAEEIAALSHTLDADTVVFDDELTPAQHRNLERVFGSGPAGRAKHSWKSTGGAWCGACTDWRRTCARWSGPARCSDAAAPGDAIAT